MLKFTINNFLCNW